MAINPTNEFPGKVGTPSADYPYSPARNVTSPGDGTGTPWVANLVNDIWGWQQGLLDEASITPSGSPETAQASQYIDAMRAITTGAWQSLTDLAAATTVKINQLHIVQGNASADDGRPGLYRIVPNGAGTPDGVTYVNIPGADGGAGLQAKLINGSMLAPANTTVDGALAFADTGGRQVLDKGVDSDIGANVGRMRVGDAAAASDVAAIAHRDNVAAADYLIAQTNVGQGRLNAPSGQTVSHRIANVEIAQMAAAGLAFASGKGISFGDEYLKNYDEGSWTPTSPYITFSSASGRYVRIGRIVIASYAVVWPVSGNGDPSRVAGLPFAGSSVAADLGMGGHTIYNSGGTLGSITMAVQNGQSYFHLLQDCINVITNGGLDGDDIRGVVIYETDA